MLMCIQSITIMNYGVPKIHTSSFPNVTKQNVIQWLIYHLERDHGIVFGMRFALIEMKILLVRLLREYSILPGEHLESKFNIRERTVIAPEEVWVKLVKRDT